MASFLNYLNLEQSSVTEYERTLSRYITEEVAFLPYTAGSVSDIIITKPIFVQETEPRQVVLWRMDGGAFYHYKMRRILVILHKLGIR